MTPPPERQLRKVSFIVHATRGVIRDQAVRRKTMTILIIVAALMLVAGSTFLQTALNPREHAVRFILFWLACGWLTLTALLLALFDALMVRAQGRAAGKMLQQDFQSSPPPGETKSDGNAR